MKVVWEKLLPRDMLDDVEFVRSGAASDNMLVFFAVGMFLFQPFLESRRHCTAILRRPRGRVSKMRLGRSAEAAAHASEPVWIENFLEIELQLTLHSVHLQLHLTKGHHLPPP